MLLICCNFFAQIQMDEIRCVRLVAARLQGTELDDKTLTWGASGGRAWGQNVLTGAAAERRNVVMATEMLIIQPQAFLQAERAIDLTPDNKAATARVFVKLHNDMQCAPQREGFSLLNHDARPMLIEDAAFRKFSEMSNIGPWIDREGKLQWDYVIAAGFKGARSVRNGNARRGQLVESSGYAFNDKGELCIQGYRDLGIKFGALSTGPAVMTEIRAAKALDEHHTHICISALCHRGAHPCVSLTGEDAILVHLCYDPQLLGLAGQQPRRKKGLKLHMGEKCHRTAQECKGGAGCKATCNTTNRTSCQHLH